MPSSLVKQVNQLWKEPVSDYNQPIYTGVSYCIDNLKDTFINSNKIQMKFMFYEVPLSITKSIHSTFPTFDI